MGMIFDVIDETREDFIKRQHVFFVATAPSTGEFVNVSPKGCTGTFSILSPTEVAYVDFTGSGCETIAHVKENGRITFMFCNFEADNPVIVRLYGRSPLRVSESEDLIVPRLHCSWSPRVDGIRGSVVENHVEGMAADFASLEERMNIPSLDANLERSIRSLIRVKVFQVSTACGFSVPIMKFIKDRERYLEYASDKTADNWCAFRRRLNLTSKDGLPGVAAGPATPDTSGVRHILRRWWSAHSSSLSTGVAIGVGLGSALTVLLSHISKRFS